MLVSDKIFDSSVAHRVESYHLKKERREVNAIGQRAEQLLVKAVTGCYPQDETLKKPHIC
jgi:hypothetical protein